ncbi:hypothetical protein [Blautia sp. MSJ-9]|uniref:hypothetical protein n=1 Tax=Blautia sp. MSJ-9 TaxID=2841511 RepID=UPI001C1184DE|nr:hypothetical protein [Blautia sp. MSJ-9]MBU5680063.1 hypothetical protein [Blautia sp. MSJ-9]
MFHLRLRKGLSYFGIVRATSDKPDVYVQEKEQADSLVKSGYFELVGNTEVETKRTLAVKEEHPEEDGVDLFGDDAKEDESQERPELIELQGKTKAELTEYANNKGIDITGCKTKDEILQKITEAIARAVAAREVLSEG